jgi:cyclic pyranopterin phosphate synthase
MPEEGVDFLPHEEILRYEEMLRVIQIAVECGIRKVRLTGGEPLARKGFIPFVNKLTNLKNLDEITLTTNGVLLNAFAAQLKKAGIHRINISLDSLDPAVFARITGRDRYVQVWEGIREAERLGFAPIKINMVVMKGINDGEILDFARLTFKKPYHIRFIEFMPVGEQNGWTLDRFVPLKEIQAQIGALGTLHPVASNPLDGPAVRYRLAGSQGELGFIGALSQHFCHQCNRLRLTADGHLKGCLFSREELDIKTPLRNGKGSNTLREMIHQVIKNKPQGHLFMKSGPRKCVRPMSAIGG